MGLFSFLKHKSKRASKVSGHALSSSSTPQWLLNLFGLGGKTTITPETATNLSAVWCAVTMITGGLGKLPLHVYKRLDGGGKERDTKNPIYRLLHKIPAPHLTPFELKEMIIGHLLLRGNFYAEIVYNNSGQPIEIVPLHPDRMNVYFSKSGELFYEYSQTEGGKLVFRSEEILHVRGANSNGKIGQSIISAAKESLERLASMASYASDYFENGSAPMGVLSYPHELDADQADRLRESWERQHKGEGKRNRVAVLEQGLKWEQIGISNQDSQFLESREFEIEEVARWFNIPPHKLKHLKRATFSNIEHQNQEYYEDTLLPWAIRIQDAINHHFFADDDARFCEFLYDSLLITDTKTRYEAHNLALQGGWKTRNEIRITENLNPEEGLDEFMAPLNMGAVGQTPPSSDPNATSSPAGNDQNQTAGPSSDVFLNSFVPAFSHEIGRALRREEKTRSKVDSDRLKIELHRDLKPIVEAALGTLVAARCGAKAESLKDAEFQVGGILEDFALRWSERSVARDYSEARVNTEVSSLCAVVARHANSPEPIIVSLRQREVPPQINVEVKPADVNVEVKMPEQPKRTHTVKWEHGSDGERKAVVTEH